MNLCIPEKKNDDISSCIIALHDQWKRIKAGSRDRTLPVATQWESPMDKKVVTVRSFVHEYYFQVMFWVQHLVSTKQVVKAASVVRWHLLPLAKMLRGPLFLFTENGCRQLLAYTLILCMKKFILRSEARGSTGVAFCGMIQWTVDHCKLLIGLKSPFLPQARQIRHEMSALMLLYVEPDDSDHMISLAMEAMTRFLYLGDTERHAKASQKVPSTSQLKPTSEHRRIEPVGPSDIKSLNEKSLV
jgi:hypothetical protein